MVAVALLLNEYQQEVAYPHCPHTLLAQQKYKTMKHSMDSDFKSLLFLFTPNKKNGPPDGDCNGAADSAGIFFASLSLQTFFKNRSTNVLEILCCNIYHHIIHIDIFSTESTKQDRAAPGILKQYITTRGVK